jgi:hypothetical protein
MNAPFHHVCRCAAAGALAGLMLASHTALAQDATPAGRSLRADVERQVREAQEQVHRAAEQAKVYADQHREWAERYAGELLAQADFDLDYSGLAFIGSELGATREIVKNAPYTADAVTESVQRLQDGNRIVRRTVAHLARDTYGRTRQEKETSRGAVAYVFDPIDHRSFALNLQRRTAVRIPRVPEVVDVDAPSLAPVPPAPPAPPAPPMPPPPPAAPAPPAPSTSTTPAAPGTERVVVRRTMDSEPQDVRVEVVRIGQPDDAGASGLPVVMPLVPRGDGEKKSLGTRDIDGVKADGTQTTWTIAAGAIGNEKPIVITRERWFSPELQLVVMARTSDPRSGETTYRLTNLKRGEPPADLFKVPADYRVHGSERRGGG